MRSAPDAANHRRGIECRLALAALLALASQGCQIVPPWATDPSPAEPTETSAGTGEEAPTPAPAAEPDDAVEAPEVVLLGPEQADAGIDQRKERLARVEELRLQAADKGYYMDVQEAQLRQQLHGKGTAILRDGDSILLRIAGTVAFDTGASRLNPDVQPILGTISAVLTEYHKTLVVVNSHTDAAGDEDYNQDLSEARAVAVAQYLVENGVEPDRVVAVGHGESMPVDETGAPAGGWPDRRIEIELRLIVEEPA